ncbi:MAG: FAD-dependent monooxygenase, partial [Pseudomonadota bacterium]
MNIDGLNFVIAGAGIGGLAAALILRRKGARVTLVEQAPELTEIGAGLQISANGMTVLRALGVSEHGPASGLKSGGTILRDYRKGRLISEIPAPRAGPTYYFHRADLVDLLHTAAQRAGVELRLATRVSQASL